MKPPKAISNRPVSVSGGLEQPSDLLPKWLCALRKCLPLPFIQTIAPSLPPPQFYNPGYATVNCDSMMLQVVNHANRFF